MEAQLGDLISTESCRKTLMDFQQRSDVFMFVLER